ncbi:UDP-4-amino-4,6-dideoxy-N-acetyl-beta-L-altrosamine transaminase [Polynucleobacter paneuropaeus]|nr:UDP-4-amino-4,6-dideoxy-N-acetyl-beta-L-altrosamine transaminase [Polynucleobacter paneuropaeus]
MIPYGRQDISQADVDAVVEVLRSDFLTQGPVVPAFEDAVARYCGAKYAVASNSATSSLHLACLALGVGSGDIVWTTPITFVASANCALYCGAQVDFVDIDPLSYNLSVENLEKKLIDAKTNGKLPKVLIPVHLCGQSCNMAAIFSLSRKYGFKIIEDASHAIGGRYRGEIIGSCRYSDITIFSFHPVKIITTGEGGMALTNDLSLAASMNLLRSHGITRDASAMTHEPEGPWYYQQINLGFNYRMTDIQAALGLSQMQRLDEIVFKRNNIALRYGGLLADMPLNTPWQDPEDYNAHHLYVIRLKLTEISNSREKIFDAMYQAGINLNVHYIPVYHHPFYQRLGFRVGYCPEAERYYSEAISIPIYPGLTETQQDHVCNSLASQLIQ